MFASSTCRIQKSMFPLKTVVVAWNGNCFLFVLRKREFVVHESFAARATRASSTINIPCFRVVAQTVVAVSKKDAQVRIFQNVNLFVLFAAEIIEMSVLRVQQCRNVLNRVK